MATVAACRVNRAFNIPARRTLRLWRGYGRTGVTGRENRREDACLDDVDRQDFPKTLAQACQKTGSQMHAANA